MLALTAQEGDVVVRSDESQTYMHNGGTAGTMADFTELSTPTSGVTSVDGASGAVTLNHDTLTGFVSNEHIDWTTDQGATNIHANNYTDTTYDLSGYVETSTLSSYIRSDVNDIFTGRLTGSQLWLGGGVITGQGASNAKLQVNGLQRTGDIYLHELSSGVPTSSSVQLRNNAGDLEWDGDTVYHTGNLTLSGSNTGDQDLSGYLLNTTDTLDGSLTVDGGTGVATSGGTLIVRQKGDTITDGIAITSSNGASHRIWKDSSGNLNIGGSGNGSSFKQDLNGN